MTMTLRFLLSALATLALSLSAAAQPSSTGPLAPPANGPRHADSTFVAIVDCTAHPTPGTSLDPRHRRLSTTAASLRSSPPNAPTPITTQPMPRATTPKAPSKPRPPPPAPASSTARASTSTPASSTPASEVDAPRPRGRPRLPPLEPQGHPTAAPALDGRWHRRPQAADTPLRQTRLHHRLHLPPAAASSAAHPPSSPSPNPPMNSPPPSPPSTAKRPTSPSRLRSRRRRDTHSSGMGARSRLIRQTTSLMPIGRCRQGHVQARAVHAETRLDPLLPTSYRFELPNAKSERGGGYNVVPPSALQYRR